MPVSRKAIGIDKYLDAVYGEYGGFARFKELMELEVPDKRIGELFGNINRATVAAYRKDVEELTNG